MAEQDFWGFAKMPGQGVLRQVKSVRSLVLGLPPFSQSEACSIGVRVSVDLSIGTRWRKRKGAWDFRHDGIEDNFT